jgi:uncharacterized linocin/CFP29 family protein
MASNLGRENVGWDEEVWAAIDAAVTAEAERVRTARKVFPAASFGGQYIPDGTISTKDKTLSIGEASPRPFVELAVDFELTQPQLEAEARLGWGRTLATNAAGRIARAEDRLFLRGAQAAKRLEPVRVTNSAALTKGLVDRVAKDLTESVAKGAPGDGYHEKTLEAVLSATQKLGAKGQSGPYALFLAPKIYSDAFAPVGATLTSTADRLEALLSGFFSTSALEDRTGLLVSMGGQSIVVYSGQDVTTAYSQETKERQARFTVFERVQIAVREPDALAKLQFRA